MNKPSQSHRKEALDGRKWGRDPSAHVSRPGRMFALLVCRCGSAAVTTATHTHCHHHHHHRCFSYAFKYKGNRVQSKFTRLQSDLHSARLFSFQRGSLGVKSSQCCAMTQQFKMALLTLLASSHFLPLSSLPLAVPPSTHSHKPGRCAKVLIITGDTRAESDRRGTVP